MSMKKWFVILALAAFWISVRVPFEKTDVAKLSPVSALVFSRKDGRLYITSDRGDIGIGDTLEDALEDMEVTCPCVIFLDTVEYLLVAPGSVDEGALGEFFRPGTYIVWCGPDTDPGEAVDYLRNRNENVTLRDVEMHEAEIPVLLKVDGRYYLNGQIREPDILSGMDDGGAPGPLGNCGTGKRMDNKSGCGDPGGSGFAGDQQGCGKD